MCCRFGHLTGYVLSSTCVNHAAFSNSYAGIATHYVPSNRLQALETRLSELETTNLDVINEAIEEFTEVDASDSFVLAAENRKAINK
jgi:3-hydroxyisobutyryl-CoA hydrolase